MPQTKLQSAEATTESFEEDAIHAGAFGGSRGKRLMRRISNLVTRWHWVALGLLLGFLGATYYLAKAPKQYSSVSTLLIKQQTSTVLSKDQVEEIDMRSLEGLNTAAERIRRLDLLERVAARQDVRLLPGLMPAPVEWLPKWMVEWLGREEVVAKDGGAPPPPAALATWIGSWMEVSIRRGTRLIDITFTHQVPEVAKALADAVAREHLAEIVGTRNEGRSSSIELLMKESEEARSKLQTYESARVIYTRALEMHSVLDMKEAEAQQLTRRYLPKHPKMIEVSAELKRLQVRFLDEFDLATSSPADKAYWETHSEQIAAVRGEPDVRLRTARALLLARNGVLQSEIASQMSVFNAMLTRLEEAGVNQQGQEAGAEVSSLARVPTSPSAPDAKKVYALGTAGGMVFGLAFASLLVRLDNKFHTVSQLEADTNQPVLAAVSQINRLRLQKAIRKENRKHRGAEAAHPDQEAWDSNLLFRPGASRTTYAEMFRVLRASVSLLGDESKRRITLFTSAVPREGKSLVSINFAMAAAAQGRRTLLIDLDLRKPSIHRAMGVDRAGTAGITELLAGHINFDQAVSKETGCQNLHIIYAGARAPNPGELLSAERLRGVLREAALQYDTVVIDSAPLLPVPDTRVIVPLVDNIAMVVRAEYVPKGAVERALHLLQSSGANASGLVFNGFKEKRFFVGLNYSYGSYSRGRYGYGTYGVYGEDDDGEDRVQRTVKLTKVP
jgi:capsular exopolysaccharide synthesis family protein